MPRRKSSDLNTELQGTIQPSKHKGVFEMADPKELQEAADAIRSIRGLPAVQRHKELDGPLRQAEEWARREYRKARDRNGDRNAGNTSNISPPRQN
jgi:hypothetical protein